MPRALAAVFCDRRSSFSSRYSPSLSETGQEVQTAAPSSPLPHPPTPQGVFRRGRSRLTPLPLAAPARMRRQDTWRGPQRRRAPDVRGSDGKTGGGGPQQAISSSVPSVVCKGTVTVWLMDSEWLATGSQELWRNHKHHMGRNYHMSGGQGTLLVASIASGNC